PSRAGVLRPCSGSSTTTGGLRYFDGTCCPRAPPPQMWRSGSHPSLIALLRRSVLRSPCGQGDERGRASVLARHRPDLLPHARQPLVQVAGRLRGVLELGRQVRGQLLAVFVGQLVLDAGPEV